MTPRDRDGSFTHTHGVMHLFPTGVKKVNCGVAGGLTNSYFKTYTRSLISLSHLTEVNETLCAASVPMKKRQIPVCSQRILRMVVTRRVPGGSRTPRDCHPSQHA